MKELEILLNTLIKMGWKPKGREGIVKVECLDDHLEFYNEDGFQFWFDYIYLVSINSGLWQFCTDKLLIPIEDNEWEDNRWLQFPDGTFEYRLLESALIPEEELGQFLIENIKTE